MMYGLYPGFAYRAQGGVGLGWVGLLWAYKLGGGRRGQWGRGVCEDSAIRE